MAKKLTTSLNGFKERQCTMAIVLDIRSNRKDVTEYRRSGDFPWIVHSIFRTA